jgi:hypothetical protein
MHSCVSTVLLALATSAFAQSPSFAEFPAPTPVSVPIGAGSQDIHYNPNYALGKRTTKTISLSRHRRRIELMEKRAACDPQPLGAGPAVSPDSDTAFLSYQAFSDAANGASTPEGYNVAFTNLKASNNAQGYVMASRAFDTIVLTRSHSYLGYTSLSSYDASACAAACSAKYGCAAFNIYFERDPSLEPGAGCLNPASTTVIKCVFWGGPVTPDNAVNNGQWRNDFHVVIAGSNGYVNTTQATINGWNGSFYGIGAINAPNDCHGNDTYMGYKFFDDNQPYDPSRCAAACVAQNQYNTAHPPSDGSTPQICNFFNSYLLNKNGVPQGQVCSMYTEAWPSQFANNYGQNRDDGSWTISWSYGFANGAVDAAACLLKSS